MRIVSGRHRGLTLNAPEGLATRPTSDRVREALFNILVHGDFDGFKLDGARVLDLFAGSGALGLEALSRGARYVLFVEDAAPARASIHVNVESMQATGHTRIYRRDATALGPCPANAGGAFNLVFADPPYLKGLIEPALESALGGGWIAPGAILVLESSLADPPKLAAPFMPLDARSYGETLVTFARLSASE
jgi:16S rRNA (guanine966-N2)-methyltransferase